ncbi:AraC family transcriptional regulator [Clostridium polynesiense]|uniref:AraC family transcriptional regulator n=1 Tax=Clostridium polynesiense TaxID=1325933 RepID=UPI00058EA97A|nr:AraC family transcriptional regulator [Clostridium polynesiense]
MEDIKLNKGRKRGYLKSDFELFHIKDQKSMEFDYHHHDFHKIVVFISGKVTYYIEGKAYVLKPWDILLVGNTEIHKPSIDSSEVYERIVLWVYPEFLEKNNTKLSNLMACFNKAREEEYHLIRMSRDKVNTIKALLKDLEEAKHSSDFAGDILKNSLFIQFIIQLNRIFLNTDSSKEVKEIEYDENISSIINYINSHLDEELSIDSLSTKFYMSRYYLMHKFKKETGTSLYSFIIQKRLILAKSLIRQGLPMFQVAAQSGFGDYSTFVRAFKKRFGMSPRVYYNKLQSFENTALEEMDL